MTGRNTFSQIINAASLLFRPPQIKLREECADVVGRTNGSVNQAGDSNISRFHESVHLVWFSLRSL
jgi:hypothetical protein